MENKNSYIPLMSLFICLLTSACSPLDSRFKQRVSEMLAKNPEILKDVIQENPHLVAEAFEKAIEVAQTQQEKRRLSEQENLKAQAIRIQYRPEIRSNELIRGTKNAPITIVMYSDFECHLCAKGASTVRLLLQEYHGQIQVIYKHLPQQMHANAMISAKYYEALRLQNEKLAVSFHDQLFNRQHELRRGESFLKQMVQEMGADLRRLAEDLESDIVRERIEQDRMEAREFGLRGTPSFLLNGIPIAGAYPTESFHELISMLDISKSTNLP